MSSIGDVVAALQAHLLTAIIQVVDGNVSYRIPVEPIICKDGTRFSIQAGQFYHCSPQADRGPWDTVEVMTLGARTPRNWKNDEDGLAGWIPIDAVAQEILERGYIQVVTINEED